MGALFRLPTVESSPDDSSRGRGGRASASGSRGQGRIARRQAIGRARPSAAVALVLGNEGAGTSPAIEAAAERRIAIPLAPGAESLNVAVAAGILLYEVLRDD